MQLRIWSEEVYDTFKLNEGDNDIGHKMFLSPNNYTFKLGNDDSYIEVYRADFLKLINPIRTTRMC